jgi:hypothetical protein
MDLAPGRIGFMSTQRRGNRWQRRSCTECSAPGRRFLPSGVQRAGPPGEEISGLIARRDRADASGGTAPPSHPGDKYLSPGFSAWLATNSLQSGYRIVQLVRQDLRLGSPPFGAGRGLETGTPATHGSSLPHIPSPSGFEQLHPTLPRVLAGRRRWAERYDGKRDLHLQHAA